MQWPCIFMVMTHTFIWQALIMFMKQIQMHNEKDWHTQIHTMTIQRKIERRTLNAEFKNLYKIKHACATSFHESWVWTLSCFAEVGEVHHGHQQRNTDSNRSSLQCSKDPARFAPNTGALSSIPYKTRQDKYCDILLNLLLEYICYLLLAFNSRWLNTHHTYHLGNTELKDTT